MSRRTPPPPGGEDWEHVVEIVSSKAVNVVPISEEEEFELVFPDSTTLRAQDAHTTATTHSQPRQQQQQQWQHQQSRYSSGRPMLSSLGNRNYSDDPNFSLARRMKEWRKQRDQQRTQLGQSITSTFAELAREQPDKMEEEAIQRAMELSMLDFALVDYQPSHHRRNPSSSMKESRPAHQVLGVPEHATPAQIKSKYRELARYVCACNICM
jgi:hypothetical protein